MEEEVFRNWNELISVHKHEFDRLEVEVSKPVIVSCGTYPSWLEAGGGGGWRGGNWRGGAGGEAAGGEGARAERRGLERRGLEWRGLEQRGLEGRGLKGRG